MQMGIAIKITTRAKTTILRKLSKKLVLKEVVLAMVV